MRRVAKAKETVAHAAALAATKITQKSKGLRNSGEQVSKPLTGAQAERITGDELRNLIDEALAVEKRDQIDPDTFIITIAPHTNHERSAVLVRLLRYHGTQPNDKEHFLLTLRNWCLDVKT